MIDIKDLKFNEQGLIPAIVQDARTRRVLMLAWMNEESLRLTLETGWATYFSRSRQQLWKKGETSGHVQKVLAMRYDCDADALPAVDDARGFADALARLYGDTAMDYLKLRGE